MNGVCSKPSESYFPLPELVDFLDAKRTSNILPKRLVIGSSLSQGQQPIKNITSQ